MLAVIAVMLACFTPDTVGSLSFWRNERQMFPLHLFIGVPEEETPLGLLVFFLLAPNQGQVEEMSLEFVPLCPDAVLVQQSINKLQAGGTWLGLKTGSNGRLRLLTCCLEQH